MPERKIMADAKLEWTDSKGTGYDFVRNEKGLVIHNWTTGSSIAIPNSSVALFLDTLQSVEDKYQEWNK